jgi:cobalt-zinc-cadmium efflux system outer membrane protein
MTKVESCPWGSDIKSFHADGISGEGPETVGPAMEKETLTLEEALALALMKSPKLAAVAWETKAAQARATQAKLRSNPELELEAEELGTDGATDDALITVGLSSAIDLWNTRGKRTKAAKLGASLAQWDYEASRLRLLSDTSKAFVSLLAAQEQVRLAEEQCRLAQEVHRIAVRHVAAGALPKLEQTKSQVNVTTSKLDLGRAENALKNQRQQLSALWGTATPHFKKADGDLAAVLKDVPALDKIATYLAQSPEHARLQQEVALQEVNLSLEKADRLPEISVSAKLENSRAESETTLGAGFGVSLPIFDRKQGGIAEAKANLSKAQHERRAAEVALQVELAETHRTVCLAVRQVNALKEDALPAARQAFDAAQSGYKRGKYALLDVLDAQGTLFETEGRYIDALVEYHDAVADLQRLIGRRLDRLEPNDDKTKE